MFDWWRRRRRRKLWEREPFPDDWRQHLDELPFVHELDDDERARLERFVHAFVSEKYFIGANEMEIDDRVRVVIAAAACRLVLNLDLSYYDRLTEIVVYPSHFLHPGEDDAPVTFGEAHAWGTVVLSWQAVWQGMKNPHDGHDTAIHEFAHVLDRADGTFDGTPELCASPHYRAWARVMSEHFLALRDGREREQKVLDDYGAKNEAEFFAVATEAYFETPDKLEEALPDLYAELEGFYGRHQQRPARRKGSKLE